jgi:hypothetical protein
MKNPYFIYDGKFYPAGTIVILKARDPMVGRYDETEVVFLWHLTEKDLYAYQVRWQSVVCTKESFERNIVQITDKIDPNYAVKPVTRKQQTLTDELNVDGLLPAWILYTIAMIGGTIFNDRVLIWFWGSIWFFRYRSEKLRKAGFKQ